MVYCGKPSRACAECRLRRTKCDYKKPSCSQCTRAGRACRGYRDPTDFMFRDEAQGLSARRERAKDLKSQKPCTIPSITKKAVKGVVCVIPDVDTTLAILPPGFSIQLGPSADEQATCFFFQNYVLGKDSLARGNFQYLSDIYSTEEIGTALADGVTSLGLVGLAHFWQSPKIMSSATKKYNAAMGTISKKLRNIDEAKTDQTMIAIMLLGLYETNTCNSRESMNTWTQHVNGATSLLQLRGIEQLNTVMGYSLFVQLRTQVIINCIQRHTTVPPIIGAWSLYPDHETIEQAAATQLSILAIKYCNLRASMSSFNDFSDPERIITTAVAIEAEYALWAKTCPMEYIYQTVTLSQRTDEVFSDHYHFYNTVWIATIWNHYRSNRILVNELILNQLNWLYVNHPESPLLWDDSCFFENQIMESNSTLLQLCRDICSSVPYFLGYDPAVPKASDRPIPKGVNGNLLLWPLYTAGVTGMVSDLMRSWVAGRLKWISDVMGIRQADPLAFVMMKRKELLSWRKGSEIEEVQIRKKQPLINGIDLDTSFDTIDPSLLNDFLPSTMEMPRAV